MKPKELVVFLEGRRIGVLSEDSYGKHIFTYDTDAEIDAPLSLSLPRRVAPWRGKPVEAFIDGVLPDDQVMRQRIARRYDVNAGNPFSLLTAIGLDCAGGAQFVPTADVDSFNKQASLRPITEAEIRQRLVSISDDRQASWQGVDEHWSLNGAQDKIALRFQDGQWYEAHGSAATTHIIKPGILKLHEQAFNEYVCLKAIAALHVPVSNCEFREFAGLPALVSERWDRKWVMNQDGDTEVIRIHQEDLCQATGHPTAEKYQSDGGPGATEILSCLRINGLDAASVGLFYIALILNFLMAGTDAHAKNYAIEEPVGERPRLAPLYDIASMFAYATQRNQRKLAMSIGGEYNWERIELRHWRKLADTDSSGDFELVELLLARYAATLPDAFADAAKTARELSSGILHADRETQNNRDRLLTRIQDGIAAQCTRVLHWFS
jgi:serine/threonine-protein kinase HipA